MRNPSYALERDPDPGAWVPIAQQNVSEDIWRNLFLVADTGIDPMNALASVSQMIRGIDPQLAIADASSMEQRLRDSLWRQRFSSSVLGAFSLAALGIAVLGVFGVTSYLVALRSHEIGVRMAVGARPVDIFTDGASAELRAGGNWNWDRLARVYRADSCSARTAVRY